MSRIYTQSRPELTAGRPRPRLFLIGTLVVVAAVSLVGCTAGEPTAELAEQVVAVEVQTAVRDELRQVVRVSGELEPKRDVYLAPTLGGSVEKVYARPGDAVEADTVIVELDDSDLELQVEQAAAALKAARAGLKQVEEGAQPEELAQLEGAVEQAHANRQQALVDYQRMDVLYREGAISKQLLEQTQLRLTVAETQYEQAKRQLELAQKGATTAQKEAAQAQVAQAEAAYELARRRLEDMRLAAPFAGIVTMVNAAEGQLLAPQNPVVRIVEMDRLRLEVGVGSSVINSLARGDEVVVYVKAVDRELAARLEAVSPAANPQLKQYIVEVELPNPELELKPGMLAEVELVRALLEAVIVIPCEAVILREEAAYVFVVDEGIARERRVVTGIDNGDYTAVLEGLNAGDEVVVKGQEFLSTGVPVRVQNPETGGSSK